MSQQYQKQKEKWFKAGKSQAKKEIFNSFPELYFHESLDKLGFYYIKEEDFNKLRSWIRKLKEKQLKKLGEKQ